MKSGKILVVDIEATCWEGRNPPGQENDIIEVGVCLLDVDTGEISANRGILVIPERSQISKFCTQLTSITPGLIEDEGIYFDDACDILEREYDAVNRVWASYGDYDRNQFQRQCSETRLAYPFGPSHINVKTMFAQKRRMKHSVGMASALEMLKLPLEGTHHRGVDDAKNIAKILRWVLNN
ncbi:3'-5' exonuclease [Mucilaginibacter psychrotolerans]|uniref:Exonuclease domain-containing protein n=1 Tax=Mucilaginibacter psychrotolerans TaxID=1524096 RepID=A0A4Y8SAJ2_9SPHI|nr:3'-5' exonuclease [Mucilaginibacter psychrotolerans]TFF35978.1 exonuclease domain-containing protein [Mucilaginibacter psychrotolerans]